MSRMEVFGAVRMRRESLSRAAGEDGADAEWIRGSVRPSPAWCEVRYLRTLRWLEENAAASDDYVLLWVFALIDEQPGFALDVAYAYRSRFENASVGEVMVAETLSRLSPNDAERPGVPRRVFSRIRALMASLRHRKGA
jgi:hypothetical protein